MQTSNRVEAIIKKTREAPSLSLQYSCGAPNLNQLKMQASNRVEAIIKKHAKRPASVC